MTQMRAHIFQAVQDALSRYPEITVALIFGSVAKDTFTSSSDLDLAIGGPKVFSPEEKVAIINQLSALIGREVDLIDLGVASGTVFKQALTTGVPVFIKDSNLLARYASRMVFDDADFHAFRRKLMKVRRKRVFDAQ